MNHGRGAAAPCEEIAMYRLLLQFSACFGLGLVVSGLILIGLMFFDHFALIQVINQSGRPLASVALQLLPAGFWDALTGTPGAASHVHVQSFLQLCVAFAQVALLLAAGFFRLWYWR